MKHFYLFFALLWLLSLSSFAQNNQNPLVKHSTTDKSWITFDKQQQLKTNQVLQNHRDLLGLAQDEALQYEESKLDALGFRHDKYQQTYKGIPIEDAIYSFHEEGGMLSHATGKLATGINVDAQAKITEQQAFALALQHLNAERYAWESPQQEVWIKEQNGPDATFLPKGELVIASPHLQQGYRLAYRFEVLSLEPEQRVDLFVDAINGKILKSYDKMYTLDTPATGTTSFYGQKNFTCKHEQNLYKLEEDGRNIRTLNAPDRRWYSPWDSPTPFVHYSTDWTGYDPAAIDVHWGIEQWYDYFDDTFGWQSYNGNGNRITSLVHMGKANASWNGQWLSFGDGKNNTNTWTSIDIVAHELTHALIERTASLKYWGESGALNESFADIFGTVIEYYTLGNQANWIIGEEINGTGIRSMVDPTTFGHPKEYNGPNWYYGNGDNGGVHTNSGVPNHWFYLLANGDTAFNGIGIDAASKIVFRTLRYYLTYSSKFIDARNASIQAARDLFGAGSDEENAVCAAWEAVGVGTGCAVNESISFTYPINNETLTIGNTVSIQWASSNNFPKVSLDATVDGGTSWFPIVTSTTNDGEYQWFIPNLPSTQTKLRIRNAYNVAIEAISPDFTLGTCDAVANFTGDSYTCIGGTLSFFNTSTNAGTSTWLLDGNPLSNDTDLSHTFTQAGNYQLELQAGTGSCYSSITKNILIVDAADVANFTHQGNGLTVTFSASSEDANATYAWSFGDGNFGTGMMVTHTFARDSLYEVCLEEGNACGNFVGCRNVIVSVGNANPDLCKDELNIWTSGDGVRALLDQDSIIWSGTDGGLVRWDKADSSYLIFNTFNSILPDNEVYALALDNQDNLWVGTENGLVKIDISFNWEIFNASNSDLPSNYIHNLNFDNQGNIWIGAGTRLVKFDGNTDWEIYSFVNNYNVNDDAYVLEVDGENNIWLGTEGGGLTKFDGNSNWEVYDTINSSLPDDRISALKADLQGNIWIGMGDSGLAKFDGNTNWEVYNTTNSDLPSDGVKSLELDTQGNIWIGMYDEGLAKFDGISNWEIYNSSNTPLYMGSVYSLHVDEEDNVLVGLYQRGFAKFDGISNWKIYSTINSGLVDNYILALATDVQGHVWVGTFARGLTKFDGNSSWMPFTESNSGLPRNWIRALEMDSQGNIWIGTLSGGLAKFDGSIWETYNVPGTTISALEIDEQDNIWIGGSGRLIKFDGDTVWETFDSSNSGLPSSRIEAIELDRQGNMWVGTRGGGLIKFDRDTIWEVYNTANSDIPYDHIEDLRIDSKGNIWVGFASIGGFGKFDGNTNWEVYNPFNFGSIQAIEIDAQDNIWIGTWNQGLVKFDGDTKWEVYNSNNSNLLNSPIRTLEIDLQGNVWVGTQGGLARLTSILSPNFSFLPVVPCSRDTLYFTNKTLGADTYEWQINGTTVSSQEDLVYLFPQSGTYEVSLIASDSSCSDIYTRTISIPAAAEELDLPEYTTLCGSTAITLDARLYTYASYEWQYNNDSIGNQATILVDQTGDYYLTVIDSCGGTATDTITVILDNDCVWPGDINKDSIVNNFDLLFLGLAYGSDGTARPSATLDFIGQAADTMTGVFQNGVNFKHADTNGDGFVNNMDTSAIRQNYDRTNGTAPEPLIPSTTSPIVLVPTIEGVDFANEQLDIGLSLYNSDGSPVSFYGLGFTLHSITPNSSPAALSSSLALNTAALGQGVIGMAQNSGGDTEIGITGTDHQNILVQNQQANIGSRPVIIQIASTEILETTDTTVYLAIFLDNILMLNNQGDTLPVSTRNLEVVLRNNAVYQVSTTAANCTEYGTATISNSDSTQAYEYLWSNGTTGQSITGLLPGNYNISVVDAQNSSTVIDFTISGIEPLQATVVVSANTATAQVSGGTGNYSYLWETGETTQVVNNLQGGNHLLTVMDEQGCLSYTGFTIDLPEYDLSGTVNNCNGEPINNVKMGLRGDTTASYTTSIDGSFFFNNLNAENHEVSPTKLTPATAIGLTGMDLILINRHIIGTTLLTETCDLIAADVNESCSITGLDALFIKRIILGNAQKFPSGKIWSFLPDSYVPPAGSFPCNFPEYIPYMPLSQDEVNQNFTGIKLGDVNSSADPGMKQEKAEPISLSMGDYAVKTGDIIEVPITAQVVNDIIGLQYTHSWDPTILVFEGFGSFGLNGLTKSDFGLSYIDEGRLPLLWLSPDLQANFWQDEKILYTLRFKVLGKAGAESHLSIDSQAIAKEAYTSSLARMDIISATSRIQVRNNEQDIMPDAFTLYNNIPNPFSESTIIQFFLPQDARVKVKIYDALGHLVFTTDKAYSTGLQQLTFYSGDLNSGIYLLRVETEGEVASRKLLITK